MATTDRVLAVAPFFHAVGFGVVANGALHAGATLVTMPRFDVEQFLEVIERYRVTATIVVPPIVLALAKHPAVTTRTCGRCASSAAGRRRSVPKAFVVRVPGSAVSAEEIMEYVLAPVAPYKRLRAVEFIEAVPTSPAGKTLRRLLRIG